MGKRIFLFITVNALILISISLLTTVLQGVFPELGRHQYSILAFSLIWGFGGALISLFLSKSVAKRAYGLQMLSPNTSSPVERRIMEMVYYSAKQAGIKMPEVGVYSSEEVNAFATGWNRNKALVAVSEGLINGMNENEVEAVIAHEVSHIANGDMITLTLIQGVVNSFVLFMSRIIASVVVSNRRGGAFLYLGIQLVLEIVFTFFGAIVVAYFSRWREYRADAGAANLVGRDKMIQALERLKGKPILMTDSMATFKVSGFSKWGNVFATHPSLDKRIKALQKK